MKMLIDVYNPAIIAAYADRPHIIEQALADLIIDRVDRMFSSLETELEAETELAIFEADLSEHYDGFETPSLVELYDAGVISVERIVEYAFEILDPEEPHESGAKHPNSGVI